MLMLIPNVENVKKIVQNVKMKELVINVKVDIIIKILIVFLIVVVDLLKAKKESVLNVKIVVKNVNLMMLNVVLLVQLKHSN